MGTKQHRVFWVSDEWNAVTAAVIELWPQYLHRRQELWTAAQIKAGLPQNRLRPYTGPVSVWFGKNFNKDGTLKTISGYKPPAKLVEAIPAHLGARPLETPSESPPVSSETKDTHDDLEVIGASVHILSRLVSDALAKGISQGIAQGIIRAVTNPDVVGMLSHALHPERHVPLPAAATPPAPSPLTEEFQRLEPGKPRNRLPRILVAGMKPNQTHFVTDQFKGRADFRFWESSDAIDLLKQQADRADAAVGMISFMGHPADQTLRARVPLYIAYQGGVTTVKNGVEKALRRLAGYKE